MKGGSKKTEEHPYDEEREVAKAFLRLNPPEYFGSTDPSVTWNWIIKMEETFDVCGCDEEHKVNLAVRMLRGWGLEWWATFNGGIGKAKAKPKASSMDWVEFKNRLVKDFCLEEHKSKLETEFLSLEKGDMSVEEYAHEFVEKMRVVKHLVKDEGYKIRRFMEGLPEWYKEDVGKATTLTEAIFSTVENVKKRTNPYDDLTLLFIKTCCNSTSPI